MTATTGKASPKALTRKEPPFVEMTFKGHEDDVDGVAFIAGTRLLVTGSDDKSLRVWDLDTGKQVGEPLLGHDAEVRSVTASPDGRWIVSGGRNGSILVWEVGTNKRELKRVPISVNGHDENVMSVIFAPDSETFASASRDETVCIWRRETGKIVFGPLKVGSNAFSVAYSPDGTKLAAGTHQHIIVWNTETGEELLKIEQRACRIAFTPDGCRLMLPPGDIIKQFDAHTDVFYSLSIAPNGTKFAITSRDKTARQLIATGCSDKLVRTRTVPLSESEKESQQKILQSTLSSDGFKTIPSAQPRPRRAPIQTSRFFDDFDPGRNNRAATTTRHAEGSGIKNMMARLFSRSSSPQDDAPRPPKIPLVDVFATRGKYRTANAQSGKRHIPRPMHAPRKKARPGVSSSSTPPAGTSNVIGEITSGSLQTGSANTSAAIDCYFLDAPVDRHTEQESMTTTTGKASSKALARKEPPYVEMTFKGHENDVDGVAFIAGTHLLVTSSWDKSLRVWDLDTGKQVGESLLGHDAQVLGVAASTDGRWIVSGGWNGSILVWEVGTNKRELKRVPVSINGHEDPVWDIVFAPDSETFASASKDETVCIWKRETGKIVFGPLNVGSQAFSVAYSPDGTKLAAGTHKHIIVWNTKTRKELLKIEQRAYRLAFTPDGLRLVSGDDKDIRISDTTTGDIIKQFDAHAEPFLSLSVAPNGTKFATTSWDKTTRFFDLTTFEPIGEPLEHPEPVHGVAFSEDSQLIATGCDDKLVRTWTVPLSESEKLKESQQKILKKNIPSAHPCPRRAPIQTSRFFDDFDPGRNNRAATTTRHAEGSGIKNMMNRLFLRSSSPQDHAPHSPRIPLVEVFATRGKYRTANAQSGKRHKPRPMHAPRKKARPSASSSSTPPAGTSNVIGETTSGSLQTGSTNTSATTNKSPSPVDVQHMSCFAVLARCFLRLSRTRQARPSASGSP
ncbi:WD40-repeat-containing domain protein [Suillus cothurnatus]|nr:WD40-repeat-containing domain protein [Suillus cothurnatus]